MMKPEYIKSEDIDSILTHGRLMKAAGATEMDIARAIVKKCKEKRTENGQ